MAGYRYRAPSGGTWKDGRSLMTDHMSHEMDTMAALFGDAPIANLILATDSSVLYEVFGKRDDGVSFRFFGSRFLQTRSYRDEATIRFERGTVRIRFHGKSSMMSVWRHENSVLRTIRAHAFTFPRHSHRSSSRCQQNPCRPRTSFQTARTTIGFAS